MQLGCKVRGLASNVEVMAALCANLGHVATPFSQLANLSLSRRAAGRHHGWAVTGGRWRAVADLCKPRCAAWNRAGKYPSPFRAHPLALLPPERTPHARASPKLHRRVQPHTAWTVEEAACPAHTHLPRFCSHTPCSAHAHVHAPSAPHPATPH